MSRTKKTQADEIAEFQKLAAQAKNETDSTPTQLEPKIENTQVKPVNTKTLKLNEVQLSSGSIIVIKPVKIKHLKDGSFNAYRLIENLGLVSLLRYQDGDDLLMGFLNSTVDLTSEAIQTLYDDLSIEDVSNIIKKSKEINGIKEEESFPMAPMGME